jgi:hypothetical protein
VAITIVVNAASVAIAAIAERQDTSRGHMPC